MTWRSLVLFLVLFACSSCAVEEYVITIDRKDTASFSIQLKDLESRAKEFPTYITFIDSAGNEQSTVCYGLAFERDSAFWRNSTGSKAAHVQNILGIRFVTSTRWPAAGIGAASGAALIGVTVAIGQHILRDQAGGINPEVLPISMGFGGVLGALIGLAASSQDEVVYVFN